MNSNNNSLNVWAIHYVPYVLCCILFNAYHNPLGKGVLIFPIRRLESIVRQAQRGQEVCFRKLFSVVAPMEEILEQKIDCIGILEL